MNLVVLVVHFALDSSIANFQATEALEVFRSVKSLATLSDLIQKLVPFLDVVAKQLVDLRLLDVPERLVRLPSLVISICLTEDFL